MRRLALAAAFLLTLPLSAAGQYDSRVEADLAGAANSATVLDAGLVQVEAVVRHARERRAGAPTERRLAVEAEVRVGVAGGLELNVGGEPLVRLRGEDDETDAGDVVLGLRYRVLDPPEGSALPALALLPFVKLPVAQPPIGSGRTDVGVVGGASFDLPADLGLDFNAGLAARGQPDGWLVQALLALGLERPVTASVSLFTDLFYASRDERQGRDSVGLDGGLIWWPARDLALHASMITSLAGTGPDWAVRAGMAVRLGR